MLERLAVFLGSRDGSDPRFGEEAYRVGSVLAERGIELVYGGGGSGLMGHLSQGVLDGGGRVFGVIPRFMVEREWARVHGTRTEMHVVATMHERKARMAERAQAFLTLPGGLGTLEELFEIWTWQTLGLHRKPIGLLDSRLDGGEGFWQPLVATLDRISDAGFMSRTTVDDLVVDADLERVLDRLAERV